MLFFAFIGSIFLIFFEKFLLLFKVRNVANEIETISVVTFSTWIRSIKSNDVYKVMLQIGVKCVQQIKMMIMKFTKRSYCELLKKALVWEYRISIVTSVWRAFCHISAYFCNWLRCEISYYRYLRWIYLQYPKKTGNGRKKKVTKIWADITKSCNYFLKHEWI